MVVDPPGTAVPHENIGGDKITVGNVAGSLAAIGKGASVIVNQIHQALSGVDELDKSIQLAERKLAESIETKLKNIANVATITHDSRFNPYKALLDYELQDAPFFYGRSAAIQEMQEKMQQSQLTILYSDSGSGKSSLLQAGLASRLLAEGHFPLYLRPYRQTPTESIKRAFLPDYNSQPELSRFADDQMSLNGFLARVVHYLGGQRLYIFIDQFEEFFTELSLSEQETFAEVLQACVDSGLPIWWVLALRKEYFSELRLFRGLKPFDNAYFLPTFKMEEAQEVITEPAKRKGISYEDGLVAEILADLDDGEEGIAPVQMQLVCYTLFEELVDENVKVISRPLYQKPRGHGASGAEGILTSHLSRVLHRQMSGRQRQIASRTLEALTNSQKMRVKKSRRELTLELGQDAGQALEETLEVLHNNHLIRLEKDENDESIYELTHDYLLAEIALDPETQRRKLAQEIIYQELLISRENALSRIAHDKLAIIEPYLANLNLSFEAFRLIDLSQEAVKERERAKEAMRKRQLKLARSLALSATTVALLVIGIFFSSDVRSSYLQRQARTPLISVGEQIQIEQHEVSNKQYQLCVQADVCTAPADPSNGYLNVSLQNLPVVGVTAQQASDYCQWLDRQLPTYEEWRTTYDFIEPSLAETPPNIANGSEVLPMPVIPNMNNGVSDTKIYHLVGNVWEWTRSFSEREFGDWNGRPEELCQSQADGSCELLFLDPVGGSWQSVDFSPEVTYFSLPFVVDDKVGFRCVGHD
ncbi:formylglycine-generating enzyme family protein [Candidatus Leptofilum sp.]|uniref:formylglycine-generating enzyme family protein n=1 Tax=Candidatus Leptofilum sp. TaxID=3241576 RepID=UPI003B5B03B9